MADIIPGTQKFHTLDKDNVTKDLGSKQLQGMREIYTMNDITATAVGSIGVPTDFQYETVAVMQAATPTVGKYATTLGYTTAGDGGGALYIIEAADPGGTNHTIALANGTFAVSQFTQLFVPQQWGVVSGDNSAAVATANVTGLNAMFAHIQVLGASSSNPSNSTVSFLGGDYFVDDTILLSSDNHSVFPIYFNGAVLRPTVNDIVVLKRPGRYPYYQGSIGSESGNTNVYDLFIDGTGTTGCIGYFIEGSYASIIQGCMFSTLQEGLRLEFALMTFVTSCKWKACIYGAKVLSLTGQGKNTGQSNRTTLQSCRWNSPTNAVNALFVQYCSGVSVLDSVFEGRCPTDADIYWNGFQSNTAVGGNIIRCHAESQETASSGDNVFLHTYDMKLKCLEIYKQAVSRGRTMVKCNASTVDFSMPYWGSYAEVRFEMIGGAVNFPDPTLNKEMPPFAPQWTGTGEPFYWTRAGGQIGLSDRPTEGKGITIKTTGGGMTRSDIAATEYFSGSATQDSSTVKTLYDATATFISSSPSVKLNNLVINTTTGASAYVVSIDSETTLTLTLDIMDPSSSEGYTISGYHENVVGSGVSGNYIAMWTTLGGPSKSFNLLNGVPLGLDTNSHIYFTNDAVTRADGGAGSPPGNRTNWLRISNPAVTGRYYYTLPAVEGTASQVANQAPIMVFSKETPPASNTDPGAKGEIRTDASYIYVCYDTDKWRRSVATAGW